MSVPWCCGRRPWCTPPSCQALLSCRRFSLAWSFSAGGTLLAPGTGWCLEAQPSTLPWQGPLLRRQLTLAHVELPAATPLPGAGVGSEGSSDGLAELGRVWALPRRSPRWLRRRRPPRLLQHGVLGPQSGRSSEHLGGSVARWPWKEHGWLRALMTGGCRVSP